MTSNLNQMSDEDLPQALGSLLRRQLAGDARAREAIAALAVSLVDENTPTGLPESQEWALRMILQEWDGMFSFDPGRVEGLPALISLTELTANQDADDIPLYESDHWRQLVDLRGPVDGVQVCRCTSCHREYVQMGMSGFLDLDSFVCSQCGDVFFRSSYARGDAPGCPCGGSTASACPGCGSRSATITEQMSPYQYFRTHRFHRDD
jgi:hypothetical protein